MGEPSMILAVEQRMGVEEEQEAELQKDDGIEL
jgi:hypothetical protein